MDGKVVIGTDLDDSGLKSGLDKVGSTVSKGFGAAAKGIGVAVGAAAVAVGTLVTSATKSYAEYEQLVGGVDKLFKDSSQKLQDYANIAYKTAGLSANEYMNTVTSFSASLISSLGGDAEKAADYADRALIAMSDNANTFGTDMQSIQYAYQGFAKQNFTIKLMSVA